MHANKKCGNNRNKWTIKFKICKSEDDLHKYLPVYKGGGWMCDFLKPLFKTQELSQTMSYSSEIRYGSCFYDVY